jgi:hypothetical protein
MGSWYTIGILAGIGASLGVLAVALIGRLLVVAAVLAAVAAGAIGIVVWHWPQAVAGVIGALCGAAGAWPLVTGALRRGGTRAGTAALLGVASLIGIGLAFIPIVGYLEPLAVLVLGARLRRRAPDRHAGLRTLARD